MIDHEEDLLFEEQCISERAAMRLELLMALHSDCQSDLWEWLRTFRQTKLAQSILQTGDTKP